MALQFKLSRVYLLFIIVLRLLKIEIIFARVEDLIFKPLTYVKLSETLWKLSFYGD